jgi:hypothetical protein
MKSNQERWLLTELRSSLTRLTDAGSSGDGCHGDRASGRPGDIDSLCCSYAANYVARKVDR